MTAPHAPAAISPARPRHDRPVAIITGASAGIGAATAERMIAKLRRRMPKFALLVAREAPGDAGGAADVLAETFEVLRSLGHSETEARRLVDGLREGKKKFKDVQEALEAIYRQMYRGR
jgi:Holliday junction DNA helicase RuvA